MNAKSVKNQNRKILKLSDQLQKWYLKNARRLPWRRNNGKTPDPYRVWLSEVMLQQTQVATVIPYFEKFIQTFPEVGDLARAELDEVYSLWAGLGYYSRARNLHRGAAAIHQRLALGKGYPSNREEWLEIPGVGPYTAGAVCSISLNQSEAIVDGNVVRVLSRIFAIEKLDSTQSEIWRLSKNLVQAPGSVPRVLNQSMMELGAMVCRPRNPACGLCPVKTLCLGQKDPLRFPEPKKKKSWKKVNEEHWILFRNEKVFLVQNQDGKWRRGLWDFPAAHSIQLTQARWVGEERLKYVVTRHKVERKLTIFKLNEATAKKISKHGKWFDQNALPGVPAPVRKMIQRLSDFDLN